MAESNSRSVVWEYFKKTKTGDKVVGICNIGTCKTTVQCPTGSTTGLYAHLRSAHKKAHKECETKNDEIRKRKLEEQEKDRENNKRQVTVDGMLQKKAVWSSSHPKSVAITNAVGKMIAVDMLPYDFVEGRGFRELMALLEPQYQVPSRTTFSRSVIPDLYNKVRRSAATEILEDFADIPAYSFSTDLWTSRAQDPFISFCLSYISPDFELKMKPLENKPFPGEHTGECILESLEKTVDNWELPRNVPIYALRDNGSNMKSAMNLSQTFTDLSCFAHTLQLTINDAVNDVDGMQTMLSKCRRIVSHYHHSCLATQNLHREQKRLGRGERELIISVATRWNSDYLMIQRLCEEKEAVTAELAVSGKVDNLTNAEWKLAEGYRAILQPFEQASRELCGRNYPTLSMKIPALHGLNKQLQRFIDDPSHRGSGITLARKLKSALEKRFPRFASTLPDAACTYLDPRYKTIYFSKQEQASLERSLHDYLEEFDGSTGNGNGMGAGNQTQLGRGRSSCGQSQEEAGPSRVDGKLS